MRQSYDFWKAAPDLGIRTPPTLLKGASSAPTLDVNSLSISDAGVAFLFALEGRPNISNRLYWPGGASGVTLGAGYDMKQRSRVSIEKDLAGVGIPKKVAEKWAKGAGLTGHNASSFCFKHKETVLLRFQEEILLRKAIKPKESIVRRWFHGPLMQHEFDALVSVTYNPGWSIVSIAKKLNKGHIQEAILDIKSRTKSNGVIMAGLEDRRRKEISLFKDGLYK